MTDRTAYFRSLAPRIMRDLMKDLPWSKLDAAACLGNLGHESNGFRTLQEVKPLVAGSRGGYGWGQWTGPRRRQFEAWAKEHGYKLDSYEANYGFLVYELFTSEKSAVAKTKQAKTLAEKVKAFELSFERAGIKHYEGRQRWAEIALAEFEHVKPKNEKPLVKSRTMGGAALGTAGTIAAGATAVQQTLDTVASVKETAQQAAGTAKDAVTAASGVPVPWIVFGCLAVVLIGLAIVAYARWDDAGRPVPWSKP